MFNPLLYNLLNQLSWVTANHSLEPTFLFFNIFIGVQLLYNGVLVSAP